MILATYKCGCPPKEEKPPCSPCCASRRVTIKSATPSETFPAVPKVDESLCCPTKPSEGDYQRPGKLRSEIADKGLPYKEIEAIINNNRVVIRTQTLPGKPEYDPPCDCNEDDLPVEQITPDETQLQSSGQRTVTLFPRPQDEDTSENLEDNDKDMQTQIMTIEQPENPNIFLFRMRKQSVTGDKRYNIDLEFKTPRPWSKKKRLEYIGQQIQPMQSATVPTTQKDDEERKTKAISARSRKRKRL